MDQTQNLIRVIEEDEPRNSTEIESHLSEDQKNLLLNMIIGYNEIHPDETRNKLAQETELRRRRTDSSTTIHPNQNILPANENGHLGNNEARQEMFWQLAKIIVFIPLAFLLAKAYSVFRVLHCFFTTVKLAGDWLCQTSRTSAEHLNPSQRLLMAILSQWFESYLNLEVNAVQDNEDLPMHEDIPQDHPVVRQALLLVGSSLNSIGVGGTRLFSMLSQVSIRSVTVWFKLKETGELSESWRMASRYIPESIKNIVWSMDGIESAASKALHCLMRCINNGNGIKNLELVGQVLAMVSLLAFEFLTAHRFFANSGLNSILTGWFQRREAIN